MSAPIQRYNTFNGGMPNPQGDDGKWCLYTDHKRIVAALQAQLQTMRGALERIKVETGTSTSAWHIADAALAATEPK